MDEARRSGPGADDLAAIVARRRHGRCEPRIDADPVIRRRLLPGERVLAVHDEAGWEARTPDVGARLTGRLYVTSRRLVLVGAVPGAVRLVDIKEAVVSGRRLLLVLGGGAGLAVTVDRPRALRAELAMARASRDRPVSEASYTVSR